MRFRPAFAVLPLLIAAAACQKTATPPPAATASPTPVAAATAPAGHDWAGIVTRTADTGYRMGNPDAPVKLVEFGSRSCPHCAAFAASGLPPLTRDYVATGKVSYEFRDWLRGGEDVVAALLGRCKGPEAFFPLLAAQFVYQPTTFAKQANQSSADAAKVTKAPEAEQPYVLAQQIGYLDFARDNGIDDAAAHRCLRDLKTAEAIGTMNARAHDDYKLSETPTFMINGKIVDAATWPELEAELKTAGA